MIIIKEPRLLLISHSSFGTTSNMGKTFMSLFHGYDKSRIAHLYFHFVGADADYCSSSYQITDFDVLKSIIRKDKCGGVYKYDMEKPSKKKFLKTGIYSYIKEHKQLKLTIRDVIWKIGNWETKDLWNWVETYNPECIFFATGDSVFVNNIVLCISQKYNIPIVSYFCDDYYEEKLKLISPVYKIRKRIFNQKIIEIINKSRSLLFISESMRMAYEEIFNKKGHTLMTACKQLDFKTKKIESPILISYVGNFSLGRWKVLAEIGKAINIINQTGIKIKFEVYSINANKRIVNVINANGTEFFKGELTLEGVLKKIEESDVLLHVESFEKKYIKKTRHSISTKISEYIGSRRIILTVGPEEVASVSYLKYNKAAYVIDNFYDICSKLKEFFIEYPINESLITNAIELANRNHNLSANSLKLKAILNSAAYLDIDSHESVTSLNDNPQ